MIRGARGRPRKALERRLSASLTIRLTEAEYEALRVAARGGSLGAVVRAKLFSVTESLTRRT